MPASAEAQHIGCRWLGVGCPTAEDRQKALQRCEAQARIEYQGFLADALADPRLWGEGGDSSAQAYAARRARSYLGVCIEYFVPSLR